jgi:hypothetical protein
MAMTRDLDNYLRLERLMLAFDETGDPAADRIRDLMDPLWYRMSSAEIALLDARGLVDPATLVPVRLPTPPAPVLGAATLSGKTFDKSGAIGWISPADWRREAA